MKKYIIIKADTNDGDYVTRKSLVENKEQLDCIKKVCRVIKKDSAWGKNDQKDESNDPYRWERNGRLDGEDIDFFNDLCPCGEYGIHTIESVELLDVSKEEELL